MLGAFPSALLLLWQGLGPAAIDGGKLHPELKQPLVIILWY